MTVNKFCNCNYNEFVNKVDKPYYTQKLVGVPQMRVRPCTEKRCDRCGWNPAVARARLAAMEGEEEADRLLAWSAEVGPTIKLRKGMNE